MFIVKLDFSANAGFQSPNYTTNAYLRQMLKGVIDVNAYKADAITGAEATARLTQITTQGTYFGTAEDITVPFAGTKWSNGVHDFLVTSANTQAPIQVGYPTGKSFSIYNGNGTKLPVGSFTIGGNPWDGLNCKYIAGASYRSITLVLADEFVIISLDSGYDNKSTLFHTKHERTAIIGRGNVQYTAIGCSEPLASDGSLGPVVTLETNYGPLCSSPSAYSHYLLDGKSFIPYQTDIQIFAAKPIMYIRSRFSDTNDIIDHSGAGIFYIRYYADTEFLDTIADNGNVYQCIGDFVIAV